ncbi:MAG: hypothetical protein ABR499_11100 [Gemmatimonadaceae bacterium]
MTMPMTKPGARPRRTLRSIGAVVAGLLAVVVLSVGTDQLLHSTGVYPPWGQTMADSLFLLATAYRVIYGVAGGYVTAHLAPDRPIRHAVVLGVVGVVASVAGAVATWNEPAYGPKWYPIALGLIALPTSWLGAHWHQSRHAQR